MSYLTFRLEKDFLPTLISIAFGNTRGYFAHELAPTILAPYPFPMVTQENLLKATSYRLTK